MARLTQKNSSGYGLVENDDAWCDEYCKTQSNLSCRDCAIYKAHQKLGEYEDLEDKVDVPLSQLVEFYLCSKDHSLHHPKIVYCIEENWEFTKGIEKITWVYNVVSRYFEPHMITQLNKTIFVKREDARKAAEKLEKEANSSHR